MSESLPEPPDRPPAESAGRTELRFLALAVLLAVPILFFGLGGRPMHNSVEERVAVTAREMSATGDWIVPTMNGETRLQKPPLAYWLVQLSAWLLGGFDEFTARFPFACLAVGTLLATYGLGRTLGGPPLALLAALTLLTSPLFAREGRRATIDTALLFCVACAFLVYAQHRSAPDHEGRGRLRPVLFYALLGLGCLAKGPVMLVWCVLPVVAEALLRRRWRPLGILASVPGLLVFLALGLTWPVLVVLRLAEVGDWKSALVQWFLESFGKVVPSSGVHQDYVYMKHFEPWHFYLGRLFALHGPWTLLLLFPLTRWLRRVVAGVRARGRGGPPGTRTGTAASSPPRCMIVSWFLTPLLFFTLIPEKKIDYLVPLLPSGAPWLALILSETYPRIRRAIGVLGRILIGAVALALVLAVLLSWSPPWVDGALARLGDHGAVVERLFEGFSPQLLGLGVTGLAGSLGLIWSTRSSRPRRLLLALAATLSVWSVLYDSLHTGVQLQDTSIREDCREFREGLAAETPIYSFGEVPSGILFYLDRRIRILDEAEPAALETLPDAAILLVNEPALARLVAGQVEAAELRIGTKLEGVAGPLAGYRIVDVLDRKNSSAQRRLAVLERRPGG